MSTFKGIGEGQMKLFKKGYLLLVIMLFLFCSTDQSIYGIDPEMLTWNLRGNVKDGVTGDPIGNASVSYINKSGDVVNIYADSQSGDFFVKELDPGNYLFSISSSDSTMCYTSTVLQAGVTLVDTGIPLVELAEIVTLYPRTGVISGIVKGRYFENGPEFVIPNAKLSVTYIGSEFAYSSPSLFTGSTDSLGAFIIDSLPICDSLIVLVENYEYEGELYTSVDSCEPKLSISGVTPLGTIYMEPSNSNSKFRFTYSNICDVNSWKAHPSIGLGENFLFITNKGIMSSEVKLMMGTNQVPVNDTIINDSIWITPVSKLLPEESYSLSLTAISNNSERIEVGQNDSGLNFITDNSLIYITSSNVLHSDLSGKTNVNLTTVPYFVLSTSPDSSDISVSYSYENKSVVAGVIVSGDTIFATPSQTLPYNVSITTVIEGTDVSGNRISITLDGSQQFVTEAEIVALQSNTWSSTKEYASNFELYDTLWVKYPALLDTSVNQINWDNPSVSKKLFGNGPSTNTACWISMDTLFVVPDPRIQIGWGDTVGFNVSVNLRDGRKTKKETFAVITKSQNFTSLWSNTIDDFGNERDDFGLSEEVIIKTSHPILTVDKIQRHSNNSISLPDQIYKDDFVVSNDTVKFISPLRLKTGTRYGFMIDVTLTNGMKLKNVLPISWETREPTEIISANTHDNYGIYRPFKVYGDTFSVRFSQPIDMSDSAPVPFKVTLLTSNYNKLVNSTVTLDTTLTIAKITILDTLPTANVFPVKGYVYSSNETRAVVDVKFNFTTLDGEVALDKQMEDKNIEIHTEQGLCAINSNILESHKSTAVIDVNEIPRQLFCPDSVLYISFNRPLDTTIINQFDVEYFISLYDYEDIPIQFTLSYSSDLTVLYITPLTRLSPTNRYYVEIKNIPALSISGSKAINDHSGIYSGEGYRNRLITSAFMISSPIITGVSSNCLAEVVKFSGVKDNRIGCSAGEYDYSYMYDDVVGNVNVQTSSNLKFRIEESAWNANHCDSVSGYELQIRKVDRHGIISQWYNIRDKVESRKYASNLTPYLSVNTSVRYESFYSQLQTESPSGQTVSYSNPKSLFNDSSTIQIRSRPYVGIDGYSNYRTGVWGSPVSITDNVAPCDSDFVSDQYLSNKYSGGVYTYDYVDYDNESDDTVTAGYIKVEFPEDMNVTGSSPVITFYYGTFDNDTVIKAPLTINSEKTGWTNARTYYWYVNVPPGDYSNNNDGTGAFYNISVAGCTDLADNVIDSYGTNGVQAVSDLSVETRVNKDDITDQVSGSASIYSTFKLCN